MFEWIRFVLIVFLTAIDHLLFEAVLSFNTTRDFVRYRLKWIMRDKLLVIWRGRQR
jgi:hypothetical protein